MYAYVRDSVVGLVVFFFFKQKTAYEMRISDWSSDVCSSDLAGRHGARRGVADDLAKAEVLEEVARILLRHPVLRPALRRHLVASGQAADSSSWIAPLSATRRRAFSTWRFSTSLPSPTTTPLPRSEARRVGKECVSTGRSRWSP